ncbi:DNA-processing protein DprA [Virgibacillus sp. MG-45]|uniref:DNA-processing protein DprA n=1 Tax=Virgibacillus sp. MG-45 TaxID=3102791 RepID=UPI002EDAB42C
MPSTFRDRLIHLYYCKGITRARLHKLLHQDPSLTKLYEYSTSQLAATLAIPANIAYILYKDLHNEALLYDIKRDSSRYTIITIVDDIYPAMLKTIKDLPLVLFAIGNMNLLHQFPSLSVVGTRTPSNEGMKKTTYLLSPLIKQGWVIVSGMAKGIDSFAHRTALAEKGYTIAVLGSGFQHIYPKQNVGLFKEIITSNGLILSEYPPTTAPQPYHFPERNRIISGLGFGTLVIEAMERSGTLITVEQALEQGREVFATPGDPWIPQTKGCHKIIQEGAKLISKWEDIEEDWETIKGIWQR